MRFHRIHFNDSRLKWGWQAWAFLGHLDIFSRTGPWGTLGTLGLNRPCCSPAKLHCSQLPKYLSFPAFFLCSGHPTRSLIPPPTLHLRELGFLLNPDAQSKSLLTHYTAVGPCHPLLFHGCWQSRPAVRRAMRGSLHKESTGLRGFGVLPVSSRDPLTDVGASMAHSALSAWASSALQTAPNFSVFSVAGTLAGPFTQTRTEFKPCGSQFAAGKFSLNP